LQLQPSSLSDILDIRPSFCRQNIAIQTRICYMCILTTFLPVSWANCPAGAFVLAGQTSVFPSILNKATTAYYNVSVKGIMTSLNHFSLKFYCENRLVKVCTKIHTIHTIHRYTHTPNSKRSWTAQNGAPVDTNPQKMNSEWSPQGSASIEGKLSALGRILFCHKAFLDIILR
jgi:hypothetical protein